MGKTLTDAEFDAKQEAVFTITAEGTNLTDWNIPPEAHNTMDIPKKAWEGSFAVGGEEQKLTRSPLQTEQKTLDRTTYEPVLNAFVASYVKKNPLIPEAKKIAMFVHIDSGDYVRTIAPQTFPVVLDVNTSTPLQATVDLVDSETKKGAKPDGVNVIQTFVFISEATVVDGKIVNTAPVTDADYTHFGADSSEMKVTTKFDGKDGGKTAYIKYGFANNVGIGTKSRVLIITIPK